MQTACSRCGQPISSDALCQRCRTEERARRLIVGVIVAAVFFIGALGVLTYLALSATSSSSGTNSTQATNQTSPADRERPSSGASPADVKKLTPAQEEALTRYSASVQPLISQTSTEMEGVIVDLRQFLKTVNATKQPAATRRVIDDFRDQM